MRTWLAATLLAVTVLAGLRGAGAAEIPAGRPAPELAAGAWINSEPLTLKALRGRVVLLEFWTYG
jgi:hypothetical protein